MGRGTVEGRYVVEKEIHSSRKKRARTYQKGKAAAFERAIIMRRKEEC